MALVDDRYSYDRFGSKGARVGQAVVDILSKEQPAYTAEDILDEYGKDHLNRIRKMADEAVKNNYQSPFYILSLLKKTLGQIGVDNALVESNRPFNLKPKIKDVADAHANATKTLYKVDKEKGEISLVWTIPSYQECQTILKAPDLYDEALVKFVKSYADGVLD